MTPANRDLVQRFLYAAALVVLAVYLTYGIQ